MPSFREARDRFLAFAFACADLLVETEETGRIIFAAGAARLFANLPAEALVGQDFAELLAPPDRALARHLLRRAVAGTRVGPVQVCSAAGRVEATLRALGTAEKKRIAVALTDIQPAADRRGSGPHGLLDRPALEALIQQCLTDLRSTVDDLQLTLLTVDGLDWARTWLPQEVAEEVKETIAAVLRSWSLDGRIAGELAPDRYAVLHAHARGNEIERDVREVLADAGLTGEVAVGRRSLPLFEPVLGVREISEALAYSLARFATHVQGEAPRSLTEALGERLRETMRRIDEIRSTIEAARFEVVFQPVVRLPSRDIHHFEVLTRFDGGARTG